MSGYRNHPSSQHQSSPTPPYAFDYGYQPVSIPNQENGNDQRRMRYHQVTHGSTRVTTSHSHRQDPSKDRPAGQYSMPQDSSPHTDMYGCQPPPRGLSHEVNDPSRGNDQNYISAPPSMPSFVRPSNHINDRYGSSNQHSMAEDRSFNDARQSSNHHSIAKDRPFHNAYQEQRPPHHDSHSVNNGPHSMDYGHSSHSHDHHDQSPTNPLYPHGMPPRRQEPDLSESEVQGHSESCPCFLCRAAYPTIRNRERIDRENSAFRSEDHPSYRASEPSAFSRRLPQTPPPTNTQYNIEKPQSPPYEQQQHSLDLSPPSAEASPSDPTDLAIRNLINNANRALSPFPLLQPRRYPQQRRQNRDETRPRTRELMALEFERRGDDFANDPLVLLYRAARRRY